MDVVGMLPTLRVFARVFTANQIQADGHVAHALEHVIGLTEAGTPPHDVLVCLLQLIRRSSKRDLDHRRSIRGAGIKIPESVQEIRLAEAVEFSFYRLPLDEREVLVLVDLLKLAPDRTSKVLHLSPEEVRALHDHASVELRGQA